MSNKFKSLFKNKKISSIWVIPIITLLIGAWMIFSRINSEGIEITLITQDADGITAGRTVIKNKSVNIGMVKEVTLSDDFKYVIIKAQIHKSMNPLIKNDSVFWIVKPQIGLGGVTGLGTILSGVYIDVYSGNDTSELKKHTFNLETDPPVSSSTDDGLKLQLDSSQTGVISVGSPVLFRGYRVGVVEKSELNLETRKMQYLLFINKPFDSLVTENVRFWKDGGVGLSLTSSGANLTIPPLDVLVTGGISFDVPEDAPLGKPVSNNALFYLYENQAAIQNSQYTEYHEFILLFSDSIAGLDEGSPVEYRGIQLGTVSKVPYFPKGLEADTLPILSYNIPVLIKIEPQRVTEESDIDFDLVNLIKNSQKEGLRASLKTSNLITGSAFIDLDFYPNVSNEKVGEKLFGYDSIATISTGFSQIQSKVIQILNNIDNLPLSKTVEELNQTLENSKELISSLNDIASSPDMKKLPDEMRNSLKSLNNTLQNLQPGSELYEQLKTDTLRFDQTMIELNKLLNTLNNKSNALIFSAEKQKDVEPKARGF